FGLITIPEQKVHAEKAEHVVISEVYGGGGNGVTKYKNDFVELYNPTDKEIDINGWEIQYSSDKGTFGTNNTILSGKIKANGYFLVQQGAGDGGTDELPDPDTIGKINMAGSNCRVRLVDSDKKKIDLVGVGRITIPSGENQSEGDPTSGMNAKLSVQRKDNDDSDLGITNGWDTDNNANDFYPKEPTPRNSSYRVGEVEEVELKSLALGENFTLEVGENHQLVVVYSPENTTKKAVEYTSLNPEFISVDETGIVTALALGEGKIQVKSKVNESITATVDITVTEPSDKTGPEINDLKPSNGEKLGELRNPEISATFKDESEIDIATFKLAINDNVITDNIAVDKSGFKYIVKENLVDGQYKVTVELKDEHGNPTVAEWKFTVGANKKNLYFGQLHSHTNLSDGTGTVDEAYDYAKNKSGVDFLAVTDHSNWFDNDKSANLADGSLSVSWNKGLTAANRYNDEGSFVAIYGYEMTWSGSTGGYGHINTFNTPGFETRTNNKMNLKTYYDTLKTQNQSLSQLNHPGKTFGDFTDFAYLDKNIDDLVTLIEVGNGEGAVGSSGYFRSYEYYTRALDKGWHVAPSNNQDNHKGRWGNANTARTVLQAYDLSRESLYDAIRERRVYSTEDENLRISYEVNGNTMGSIIEDKDVLNFNIEIEDLDLKDKINKVSIIGDGGKIVKSFNNINTNTEKITFTLDESVSSYYYVRIDQADNDIAVTAPIWVGERENIGISTVDSDTEVITTGEEFNIETTLYNNEASAIENVKVEYYLNNGSEVIFTDNIAKIEPGTTSVSKLPHKFDKSGNYSFQVKVTVNVNETIREFKGAIDIEVFGNNEVSKVVIDGAHQNQYVTGDYAGKVTTLTGLMAQNNIKSIINKEPITDKILEDASLLILSDPQSTTNTTYGLAPQKYLSSELEAIARFVKRGGNIAITSKADYKDAVGEYGNAAQGNSVLEAIGTKIRFNDDQSTDDVTNGGQAFRLYFNNYNMESPWLKGIDETKTYSFYSGSTLIMPEDLTNIDILVRGHSTTYGSDADKQNDNIPVGKGEVVGLSVETLDSGAKVIMSGATFFSNFEMDGLDYSNYLITEKVLKELAKAPEAEVSKIKDVRVDKNNDNDPDRFGEKVVVEGYVTAASNSAAPGNSFFDVIYIQDETGGITVFGVSTTAVKLGQKVRIKGRVSSYLGDTQVALTNESTGLEIIDSNINIVEPTKLSTKDSMLEEKEGLLVKVEGKVTRIEDQDIFVNDGSGEARVYVEGYVRSSKNPGVNDEWKTRIKVGDKVSAIGLASENPESSHRLRVRDSAEVEKLKDDDTTKITLLHTNDTHGRAVKDSSVIGMDVISAIKNGIDNSMLIDAGDTTHGVPFATMNKGLDIINLMKLSGYDVMTPGNHDFNYGYERLLELSNVAKEGDNGFDIISANTKLGNNLLLNSNVIKEIDGIKIGFFGLSTPETAYKTNPNNVKGITFEDPIKTAEAQVKELKGRGANVVVAVSHLGTDVSSEITSIKVGEAVKGIDLIIDGHSHSKYPTGLILDNGTIIASTGEYAANLGQISITVNKETKAVEKIIPTLIDKNATTNVEANKVVTDKIAEIKASQNDILSKVIGNTKVDLDGARENARTKETNLGNLITDAMLYTTKADIAITNGGGIRASIKAGEITKGSIINVLPFGNYIVTKYLTGKEIKEVLEHGVKDYPATAGQFTHVAGIKYVFDADKLAGERIVSIKINGKDLNMDDKYLVATNDFMAAGGDSYPNFKDAKTENEFEALDEALELYIKHLGEVDYKVEGRITVGKAEEPENPGENPGTNPGGNDNITEVNKIGDKDGVNEVVISKPSNNIHIEIKDIESIKLGTGSLQIKSGDNIISLPFSIFDKTILEGATKVVFKMNILENSDIITGIKGIKKVFEFVLYVEKNGKIIEIHNFKEGNVSIKLSFSDEELKGLNKENLVAFYYNEVKKTFEPLETIIKGNEVTFTTNHFSKFIIAEKSKDPENPGIENPTKPENIIKPGNENGKTNSLPQTGGTNSTIVFIFASLAVL
ncbi:5'-nucleotidase C-terminal domain-containing protein, partial [Clostridium sp.]|uniref:5'-nucleotidase C-terminal domain-containing protein n=1 Tax=Clostridium sp. TaxID=1506 RepID=UPI002635AE85